MIASRPRAALVFNSTAAITTMAAGRQVHAEPTRVQFPELEALGHYTTVRRGDVAEHIMTTPTATSQSTVQAPRKYCIAEKFCVRTLCDMDADLSILVFDENAVRAAIIEAGLREAGHRRVAVVREILGLVKRIETVQPDVIVVDLENPNRDQLEHFFQVSRSVKKPVAMFVDRSDASAIEAAVDAGVSAYIVDGLRKERVKPILDMAISRFNAFSRLSSELAEARSELAERKVIERAKGILMKLKKLDEPAAYALLRRTAMNENRKIADVAQGLVSAYSLLGGDRDEA